MEEIEKRAYEWAADKPQSHGRLQGYIKGATEQKQIDDRRYDFFKEKLMCWTIAWMNDNPRGIMSLSEWVNTFRKAMEE